MKFFFVLSVLIIMFLTNSVFSQKNSANDEPLFVEFIKLKNVPACNEKDSSYCIGKKIGYKNFLNSIKIYLTSRGSIEVDKRSNTLIFTDVRSNIDYIKALLPAFDYAEIFLIDPKEVDFDENSAYCEGFTGGVLN